MTEGLDVLRVLGAALAAVGVIRAVRQWRASGTSPALARSVVNAILAVFVGTAVLVVALAVAFYWPQRPALVVGVSLAYVIAGLWGVRRLARAVERRVGGRSGLQ